MVPNVSGLYFGDGDCSLFGYLTAEDIIAHEFTHGVTSHTSRFGYLDNQTGKRIPADHNYVYP